MSLKQLIALDQNAVPQFMMRRENSRERFTGTPQTLGDGAGIFVIDSDDRTISLRNRPFLDGGIRTHRAVPIKVIRREV
jgi:hypothetical protein